MVSQPTYAYNSGYRTGQQAVAERAKVGNVSYMRDARTVDKPNQYRPNRLRTTATLDEEKENFKENAKAMAVKGGMVLFWLVAGIAVAKDILDVFSAVLDMVGVGLSATVVGAPIGLPIMVFSEIINKASSLFIDFTLVAYFNYIGGGFGLRLVIMSIGFIIDLIPGLNVLPLTTVTFFAAYIFGRVAKKAVQVAESGLGKSVSSATKTAKSVGVGAGKVLRHLSA